MKICVITPFYDEPHREVASAKSLVGILSSLGHEVLVVTSGKKTVVEQKTVNQSAVPVRVFRNKDIFIPDPFNYTILPGLFSCLRRIDREQKPQLYVVCKYVFFTAFSVLLLKWMKRKVIVLTDTFPGINWFGRSKILNAGIWTYSRTIGKVLLRMADKVVLLHERLIPVAQKLKLNYQVIHNGMRLERFDAAQAPSDLRKKRGRVVLLYLGRLESVKGYDDFLAVAEKITHKYKHVLVWFVGNNPGKPLLDTKQIKFLGFRPDIPSILKLVDVNVLPSYSEGLPSGVMEGMAAHVPAVASDVGGVGCLVVEGKTGLLFKPGNQEQMQRKLELLIKNKKFRQKLGAASHEKIKNEFNLETIEKEWGVVVKSFLA